MAWYDTIADFFGGGRNAQMKAQSQNAGKNRIGGDTIIIDQIAKEFSDKTKKQIKDWQAALSATEHPDEPRWYLLQDIFDWLSIDPHYKSQASILKGTILGNRFYIKGADGKENPEKTKLLEKKWFYNLISHMIDSVIKGYTLCQLVDTTKMTFVNIPRRNIVPQKNLILKKVTENQAFDINDPAFINTLIWVKNDEDPTGLLNDLIPQLIYKRHAEAAWAQFTERFGIPMVTAITNKSDKKALDNIESMLKKLGQAASAVLPEGTTIQIQQASGQSDPYNVFNKRIERVNSEISKRLLGGTMISDQGSSRSQSEVHERIMDEKIAERYRRMIEFEVNEQLIPLLNAWAFGIELTDEFAFDRTQQLSLKEQWEIVKGVNERYDIDAEWIAETFNIPITGVRQTASPVSDPNADTANFNKAASGKALALAAKGIFFPTYNATSCCKHHDVYMAGNLTEKALQIVSETILKHLYDGKDVLTMQMQKAILEGSFLRDALFDSWGERRLQVTYDAIDHRALSAMEYNLFHFSSLRNKAQVTALNELLLDRDKNSIKSFNDFKKAAQPLLDADQRHLQTEYNFTVAVAQNASRYSQFIEEMQGVTDVVQYQTVGDSKVRAAHAMLDGRLFSLKDTEARNLWPPNDYGCRCEMLQYLGESKGRITSGEEGQRLINWTDKQKKMFAINRAEAGQVFTANQQYMSDAGLADDIGSMTYDKYELKPLDELKGFDKLKIDKTINAKNVKELFVEEEGKSYMGFKDYLNRAIVLDKSEFTKHTTGQYVKEDRHRLFPHVADVLNAPDEVFFAEYKKGVFQTNYIKHYDGISLLVNTTLGKTSQQINTWYEVKTDEVRKGMLIKGNK